MYFDDRLATVLRARMGGGVAARTQFRQLVDLLGTLPSDARGEQVDAAWVRLAEVSAEIPTAERAAALQEPGLRLRSPRLVAELARTEPAVASAAIRAARLAGAEWLDLVPALPVPVRSLVRQRRDLGPQVEGLMRRLGIAPRALPSSATAQQIAANDVQPKEAVAPAPTAAPAPEGIGAIVQRIEAFRKRRAEAGPMPIPALQSEERASVPSTPLATFAFACDESGHIGWADPNVAPAVSGLRIAARDSASPAQSSSDVSEAFRRRQPIRAGRLDLCGAPAIAGQWQIDATPLFDEFGRFKGYQGRCRRPSAASSATAAHQPDSESDKLRQLLHELRTPVNAIQGFAEVIQQQLFGPTPHEYRAHAAAIAGDAARMLAGFDELERMAKLDADAMQLESGTCDLAAITAALAQQLDAHMAQRGGGIDLVADTGVMAVGLEAFEVERLIWRLLATLASAAAPGERLKLRLRRKHDRLRMTIALPATLALQDDLFHAAASTMPSPLSAGMFGAGFALRLAATEARAAGGKLERRDAKLRLELPEGAPNTGGSLTDPFTSHNQKEGIAG
jgi:hypothetical protein